MYASIEKDMIYLSLGRSGPVDKFTSNSDFEKRAHHTKFEWHLD